MAIVKTDNQYYNDIAAAIRSKNGESALYYPSEMAQKIRNIPSGGNVTDLVAYCGIVLEGRYLTPSKASSAGYDNSDSSALWVPYKKTYNDEDTMEHRHLYSVNFTESSDPLIPLSTTQIKVGCRFYYWDDRPLTVSDVSIVGSNGSSNTPSIAYKRSTRKLRSVFTTSSTPTGSAYNTYTVNLDDTVVAYETWYEAVAEWDSQNIVLSLYDENGLLLEQQSVATSGVLRWQNINYANTPMGIMPGARTMPRLTIDLKNTFLELDHVIIRGMNEMRK